MNTDQMATVAAQDVDCEVLRRTADLLTVLGNAAGSAKALRYAERLQVIEERLIKQNLTDAQKAPEIERSVCLKICAAYGGDPNDPVWHTAAGVAGIITDLTGQALGHARRAALLELKAEQ